MIPEASHRRSRWSEDAADDDLGPFNAACFVSAGFVPCSASRRVQEEAEEASCRFSGDRRHGFKPNISACFCISFTFVENCSHDFPQQMAAGLPHEWHQHLPDELVMDFVVLLHRACELKLGSLQTSCHFQPQHHGVLSPSAGEVTRPSRAKEVSTSFCCGRQSSTSNSSTLSASGNSPTKRLHLT